MKRTIKHSLLLAIAMITVTQFATAKNNPIKEEEKGIKFFKGTWEQALAEAKKTNKLLFVDAFATWCGPCKMMDKKVFIKQEVGDFYNKNFIPVRIDVDSKTGRPIATKYKVTAMPTYLFVAGDGKLVYRKLGYMQPKKFISVGTNALKFPEMIKKFKAGNRSKKFLNEYLAAVDNADAKVANDYLNKLSEKELLYDKNNFKIMGSYVRSQESKIFKFYLAHTKDYKDEYGRESINVAVPILDKLYAQAVDKKNKRKDAKKLQQLFNVLMKLDPIITTKQAEGYIAKIQKEFDSIQ